MCRVRVLTRMETSSQGGVPVVQCTNMMLQSRVLRKCEATLSERGHDLGVIGLSAFRTRWTMYNITINRTRTMGGKCP